MDEVDSSLQISGDEEGNTMGEMDRQEIHLADTSGSQYEAQN